jgi:hypothetical protein
MVTPKTPLPGPEEAYRTRPTTSQHLSQPAWYNEILGHLTTQELGGEGSFIEKRSVPTGEARSNVLGSILSVMVLFATSTH